MARADDTTAVVDVEVDWFWVRRRFCSCGCRAVARVGHTRWSVYFGHLVFGPFEGENLACCVWG